MHLGALGGSDGYCVTQGLKDTGHIIDRNASVMPPSAQRIMGSASSSHFSHSFAAEPWRRSFPCSEPHLYHLLPTRTGSMSWELLPIPMSEGFIQ